MYLVKFFISCIYILSIPQCISAEQKQEDFGFRYSKLSINGDKYDYQVHIPEGYKKRENGLLSYFFMVQVNVEIILYYLRKLV